MYEVIDKCHAQLTQARKSSPWYVSSLLYEARKGQAATAIINVHMQFQVQPIPS